MLVKGATGNKPLHDPMLARIYVVMAGIKQPLRPHRKYLDHASGDVCTSAMYSDIFNT